MAGAVVFDERADREQHGGEPFLGLGGGTRLS
jgi:hypothetical protein